MQALQPQPFLSNNLADNATNNTESAMTSPISKSKGKSGLIGPLSRGKNTFFNASTPYVRGFILAAYLKIGGRSFTGYIAPERKNIGMIIKFIITLKLS